MEALSTSKPVLAIRHFPDVDCFITPNTSTSHSSNGSCASEDSELAIRRLGTSMDLSKSIGLTQELTRPPGIPRPEPSL